MAIRGGISGGSVGTIGGGRAGGVSAGGIKSFSGPERIGGGSAETRMGSGKGATYSSKWMAELAKPQGVAKGREKFSSGLKTVIPAPSIKEFSPFLPGRTAESGRAAIQNPTSRPETAGRRIGSVPRHEYKPGLSDQRVVVKGLDAPLRTRRAEQVGQTPRVVIKDIIPRRAVNPDTKVRPIIDTPPVVPRAETSKSELQTRPAQAEQTVIHPRQTQILKNEAARTNAQLADVRARLAKEPEAKFLTTEKATIITPQTKSGVSSEGTEKVDKNIRNAPVVKRLLAQKMNVQRLLSQNEEDDEKTAKAEKAKAKIRQAKLKLTALLGRTNVVSSLPDVSAEPLRISQADIIAPNRQSVRGMQATATEARALVSDMTKTAASQAVSLPDAQAIRMSLAKLEQQALAKAKGQTLPLEHTPQPQPRKEEEPDDQQRSRKPQVAYSFDGGAAAERLAQVVVAGDIVFAEREIDEPVHGVTFSAYVEGAKQATTSGIVKDESKEGNASAAFADGSDVDWRADVMEEANLTKANYIQRIWGLIKGKPPVKHGPGEGVTEEDKDRVRRANFRLSAKKMTASLF